MNHLRNFRIFESDDDDDEDSTIYTGFEYSFNDIKEYLWDILDLGFKYAQSTSIQVAAWLFAEILYMIKYPKEGFNEAETLHSKELYENSKKYLGNCYFKLI
jgi:hypothetical protein